MTFEAIAQVVLNYPSSALPPASPVASYGFIVELEDVAFSAAVIPTGSGNLIPGQETEVRLRFLVDEAQTAFSPGTRFTFFEQQRLGSGMIVAIVGSAAF
ncbi:hypothetical protein [Chitinolyticbacter meiyuanensis]|uniref:hypothetical protein n=1 Tax=Chitinolyticbacter meiyuanensis TaxID=682798 RepID=UPI0011E5D3D5|nr:hypothetical protein [Chitinolyticbacter meiyuanensis]